MFSTKAGSIGFVGIADAAVSTDVMEVAQALIAANVSMIQLRCVGWRSSDVLPLARQIAADCRRSRLQLVINEFVDVAVAVDAGVHTELSAAKAARDQGVRFVGVSAPSLSVVTQAQNVADYVGFGPVYDTDHARSKVQAHGVEPLRQAIAASQIPVIAIGGLQPNNVSLIKAAGPAGWAAIGAICSHRGAALTQAIEFMR